MTTIRFEATAISLSTKDEVTGAQINTTINLTEDEVLLEHVVGALCAGASRRTVWQNSFKGTKNKKATTPPANVTMPWRQWIGSERAARAMSDDEMLALMRARYPQMFKE